VKSSARSLPLALLALLAGCTITRDAPGRGITLDVAVFEGGYGIEWHKQMAREYEKIHPEIHINLWGDPRVDEKIKPRILRRSPPDLASCNIPAWKLIVAGKLYPMDEALDSPAYGQNITWRESLVPGISADYEYQGKTYAMPSNLGAWVCWYDRRMFRQHGWEAPRTWSEFTQLCSRVRASGVAPLAFQGKYPTYAWSTLLSIYQRLVPFEQWYRLQDALPGAFLDPDFIRAAGLLQDLATSAYQPGALAMTHTESQMEWVNGRAAMVFCGLWLKNEMKKAISDEFEMACFPVPIVEGGRGDPHAVYAGGGENFYVFREAKHPREALDFLKFLLSLPSARSYIRRLDTLSPVRDATRGLDISPALQSAVKVMDQADRYFSDRLGILYLQFARSVMPDALAGLISDKITPEAFAQRLEAGMAQVRADPEIYKPAARGVPSTGPSEKAKPRKGENST